MSTVAPVFATPTAPTITPPGGFVAAGQTFDITMVVADAGVGPWTVTWYATTNPANCGAASTVVPNSLVTSVIGFGGVVPGTSNWHVTVSGTLSTSFFLCALVTDTGDSTSALSGAVEYQFAGPVVNQFVDNEQSIIVQDTGSDAPLTEFATGGAPPYNYQWYVGTGCTLGNEILGATDATYTVSPVLAGPHYYSVLVWDSTLGTPLNSACSNVLVRGEGPLALTGFGILPVDDQQVGPKTVVADVTWNAGVGPWYTVSVYAGPETTCSALSKIASQSDINATEAILAFPMPSTPSTTTYYCVTVTDSAFAPVTVTNAVNDLTFVKIDLTPALGTPLFSISPHEADTGHLPATLTWFGMWAGGVSPYTWTIVSGSSSNCANDVVIVATGSAGTLITATGTFPAPSSSTYYCLYIDDNSAITSETVSTAQLFTVGPVLAVKTPVLSSLAIDLGQGAAYEGIPETATITWSGGTGPYVVSFWYSQVSSADCGSGSGSTHLVAVNPGSNPQTAIPGFTATFHFLAPGIDIPEANTWYCATVTDLEPATPVTVLSGTTEITVSASALTAPGISIAPSGGIDAGQTLPGGITITVGAPSVTGGTPPYTITLYSGASASACLAYTTKVATASGASASFNIPSPATNTYYCATAADSSEIPVVVATGTVSFFLNPALKAVTPAGFEVPAGTGTILTAGATGGTPPYSFTWYIGAGCVAANTVASGTTYNTGILTQETIYSFSVTDSSAGTPAAFVCSGPIDITVNNGPQGVASFNTGAYAGFGYVANPFHNSITVVDTYSLAKVTEVSTSTDVPHGVAVDPAHALVYFSADFGLRTVVDCLDAATNTVTFGPLTPVSDTGAADVAYSAKLGEVFMANIGSNTVSVYTTGSTCGALTYLTDVAVGAGPSFVAVDTDNNYVFVTNSLSNTVSVLQPNGPFPPSSFAVTNVVVGSQPAGVAFDPTNHNVYVANAASGTISVINGYSLVPTATIKVGGTPQGIDVNAAAGTAYWANAATGTLGEINLATNAPMSTAIATGSGPFVVDVQLNPLNSAVLSSPALALVTNSGSNTLSVINIATNTVIATIVVP